MALMIIADFSWTQARREALKPHPFITSSNAREKKVGLGFGIKVAGQQRLHPFEAPGSC
jgi:hypothetical protein